MPDTVFYAWQSDHPPNINKNFIRDAIDRAINALNAELGVEDAVRADQDTQGVPGDINVAEVIFEKIDRCRIFIADITTITPPGSSRPSPNPNVLIEYGRASVRPGSECVVTVFNQALGNWETDRPFDLRHRRRPLLYSLPTLHTSEERATARQVLVAQLTAALREILNAPRPSESTWTEVEFDFAPLRSLYEKTSLRTKTTGRIIGFWVGLLPVSRMIHLDSPWDHKELVDRLTKYRFKLGNDEVKFETMESALSHDFSRWPENFQPMQDGARYIRQYRYERDMSGKQCCEDTVAIYLYEDGRVALAVRTDNLDPAPNLNVRWIIADVANSLRILDRVRRAANDPFAPYALLVELRYDDQSPQSFQPVPSGEWRLCPIDDEQGHTGPLVSSDPIVIGPIAVAGREHFPEVLKTVYTKLVTSAGRRPRPDLVFNLGE